MLTRGRPKALMIGSLGVLSETCEIQRVAFNRAFAALEIDWVWDRDSFDQIMQDL